VSKSLSLGCGRVATSLRGSDKGGRESDRESLLRVAFARVTRVSGSRPRHCRCDDVTQVLGSGQRTFCGSPLLLLLLAGQFALPSEPGAWPCGHFVSGEEVADASKEVLGASRGLAGTE